MTANSMVTSDVRENALFFLKRQRVRDRLVAMDHAMPRPLSERSEREVLDKRLVEKKITLAPHCRQARRFDRVEIRMHSLVHVACRPAGLCGNHLQVRGEGWKGSVPELSLPV